MLHNTSSKLTVYVTLVLLLFSNTIFAQSNTDSLRLIWQNEKEIDTVRFNALDAYYELNNQIQPDSALIALDDHYTIAKEKNADEQLFMAAKRKGNIHRLKGNYDEAMRNYKEAESIAIRLKNDVLQADIIGNLGNVFIYRKDYLQATQCYSKALKVYQEKKDARKESHMLTSLGSVYLIIDNYDLALEYYQKALSLLNDRGYEDRRTAIIYVNIGWTNFEKKLYKEAKFYYEKGLEILKVKNEKFFIAECYAALASIHIRLNLLDEAKDYAQKSLALNKELAIKSGITNAEITIAQLTYETDIDEATKQGEAILANLTPSASKESKRYIYELLYKCYKAQKKLGLSLEMYEQYTMYDDSIQAEKNKFAVAREAVKNEFEKKLYQTQVENENAQAALKLKQLKKTYAIILICFLVVIGILYYTRKTIVDNRKKREALLAELERLKNTNDLQIPASKFELDRKKIEQSLGRKINETDWNVLSILLEDPVISNKDIAEKAYMSVDGIGSSLRRMYTYFEIKESKYKKISLLMEAIKLSNKNS
ncbi:tetratricopeptide repeat protein [Kordia jejudonensis]|uniref:tetratricopeptide repeat protein n=1 Tax=Kordia jejudonensis TaxID=1348245 RepID=UPI0006293479|nr:tetratricopeptide repeat protein [Kordia jejudonensis]